jgi:hypothetical protein
LILDISEGMWVFPDGTVCSDSYAGRMTANNATVCNPSSTGVSIEALGNAAYSGSATKKFFYALATPATDTDSAMLSGSPYMMSKVSTASNYEVCMV